jgi:hypothetical protein
MNEKVETVKMSDILRVINQCLGKRKAPTINYPDILERIKENYPDFPIKEYEEEERIWFKMLPKNIADELRLFYCKGVDFAPDYGEHIFIAIPDTRASIFVPAYPKEFLKAQYITPMHPDYADYVDKKRMIKMRSNTFGVIDLAHYEKEFPQGEEEKKIYTMRFYADWIINAFPGSKEVSFDEFASAKVLTKPKEETIGDIAKIREITKRIKMLPGTQLGEQAKGLFKEIDEVIAASEKE